MKSTLESSAFVNVGHNLVRPGKQARCAGASTCMRADNHTQGITRRDLLLTIASGVGVAVVGPSAASADAVNLMAQKRAYFRYAPRIEQGVNYYVETLWKAINDGDWDTAAKAFSKESTAKEGSEKAANNIDPKTTIMERQFFTPMRTWGQTFAEKGSSPKQRSLAEKQSKFENAVTKLQRAIDQRDANEAKAAWETARDDLNDYIDVANNGLSRELRKLNPIPKDLKSFVANQARPDTTF